MDDTPTIDAWGINARGDNICGPCPYCRGWHYHQRTGGPLVANCTGSERRGHYVQVYYGRAPEGLLDLIARYKKLKRTVVKNEVRLQIQEMLETRKKTTCSYIPGMV